MASDLRLSAPRIVRFVACWLLGAALFGRPSGAFAGTVPLDYPAYDSFNIIRSTTVSDDGRYAAYVLAPEDGDPTLVIHDFTSGTDTREVRGVAPMFTADSKFVVFTVRASNDAIVKARRAHKKPKEFPPNGLGIVDLASGALTSIDLVKSVVVPHDAGSDTIAYLKATPMPSESPSPGASPSLGSTSSAAGARNAEPTIPPALETSPEPSALPIRGAKPPAATPSPDDLHKKNDGNDLVIRSLADAKQFTIPRVDEYSVSHDGAYVAFATQTKDGKGDGLSVVPAMLAAEVPRAAASPASKISTGSNATSAAQAALARYRFSFGAGHYRSLTWAPKTNVLAFASDATTFKDAAPTYAFFVIDAAAIDVSTTMVPAEPPAAPSPSPALSPREVLAPGNANIPKDWAPSTAATPEFSKDARYLYVGTAPAPTPVPSGTPEPTAVDIWNWRDVDLQSAQRHDADDERTRTYLAAIDLTRNSVAQLGTPDVRDVTKTVEPGATFALGINDTPYRRAASWRGGREDLYAISLTDGARRPIVRELRDDPAFSPTGRYVATYDQSKRAWFATRLSDGRRVDLTTTLHVPFYDELADEPDLPMPYQFQGWLDGDRAALVSDRYDVWAIDPSTGRAYALTSRLGRRAKIRFSLHQLDKEAASFSSSDPILAEGLDDASKDRELWRIQTDPLRGTATMHLFARVPRALTFFARARNGPRLVTNQRSFSSFEDLYSSETIGGTPVKFTNANPQMAKYRLGTERLISYKPLGGGAPLRGILFEPEADGSHAKRPMLVYFYERFTDALHEMPFTEPGPGTSPNLLRYVSHGYVVFVPDIAYRTGHPGQSAYDCMMPGVDAAVEAGNVDPKRVGIAGHSWAAYQIAYLITRTNRFRAAEAGAAVANMTSAYGGIRLESGLVREFQYEIDQSRIGATPWDRPDLYLENSPLFHIKDVRTPYLTIANDHDGAVPWLQGIEFATALRHLNKEAYMFEFDGEDHNLKDRENQKFWTVHLDEFFDHFLMGTPEPDWMSAGVDFLHRGERNVRPMFGETP